MTVTFRPAINVAACVFATLLLASGSAIADGKSLTGAEIKTTLSGARTTAQLPNGAIFQVDFKPDGSMDGLIQSNFTNRSISDHGTWRVEGDTMCRKWDKFRDGKDECYSMTMNGNQATFANKSGETTTVNLVK